MSNKKSQGDKADSTSESAEQLHPYLKPIAAAAVLMLMVVVTYLPASHADFIWDDDQYVTQNENLKSTSGLARIWLEPMSSVQYYPMVFSSFWLEYQLHGESYSVEFHWVNILLQGLNAILLWRVLRYLQIPGAWLAAAIFAVHPVHVESVAWVTERKNVLSGFFYLSAALVYWRFAPADGSPPVAKRPYGCYAAALVLFVAALLSKTVTASLPAALVLIVWWKQGKISWRQWLTLLPMFALGTCFGLLTAWLEKYRVGALGEEWDITLAERCIIAGRAVWFYAGKLLWPTDLTFIYTRWVIDPGDWLFYLYPATALILLLVLARAVPRIGRGPLVACLFFGGTLFPALGFIDLYPMRYSFVADHFQYLASIGIIALVVASATIAWRRYSRQMDWIAYPASGILLFMLGLLSWGQCHIYHDLEPLWVDTIDKNPTCWMAQENLAALYYHYGFFKKAEEHYLAALQLNPSPTRQYRVGIAREAQGKLDQAIEDYRQAIQVDPRYASYHQHLGDALARQGKTDQALQAYADVLKLNPDADAAHYMTGVILADRGDWNAALKCFEKAAAISPEKPQYQYNLVIALRIAGRNEEAKAHMAEAKGTNGWPAAAIVTAERLVAQPGSKAFDPALAAQLATDACVASSFGNQAFLEPLSSILSNFNDSDELVRRALADASKSAHPEVEGMLKRRIDLLRQERKRAL